jgi:hypothetical protein
MKRIVNVLSKLNWGTRACAVLVLCATTATALPAQTATLTTLHRFCTQSGCTDGQFASTLVQATNGGLYGTTSGGGTNRGGTIFKITPGVARLGPSVHRHAIQDNHPGVGQQSHESSSRITRAVFADRSAPPAKPNRGSKINHAAAYQNCQCGPK